MGCPTAAAPLARLKDAIEEFRQSSLRDDKLLELRLALDRSRGQIKELEAVHQQELNLCLKRHKDQLVEYNSIVQSQNAEIHSIGSAAEASRQELVAAKVR